MGRFSLSQKSSKKLGACPEAPVPPLRVLPRVVLSCSAFGLGRGGPMRVDIRRVGPARLRVATHYSRPSRKKRLPFFM